MTGAAVPLTAAEVEIEAPVVEVTLLEDRAHGGMLLIRISGNRFTNPRHLCYRSPYSSAAKETRPAITPIVAAGGRPPAKVAPWGRAQEQPARRKHAES